MAGVKGRSGGARPNTGGARPGAGRKPVEPDVVEQMEPMEFLEGVMTGSIDASPAQVSAAKALMAYKHRKLSDEGKKEAKDKAAADAAKGRFAPKDAPRLVAVK